MTQPVHIEPGRRVTYIKADFDANVLESHVVNLRSYALRGIYVPAGIATTIIKFKAANVEITDASKTAALDVFDDTGTAVQITIAASRYVVVGTEIAEKLNAMGDFILLEANAVPSVTLATVLTLVCVATTK